MGERGKTEVAAAPAVETGGRTLPGEPYAGHAACQRLSLTLNDIHQRAHGKWAGAGRPLGDSSRFWLEAERELLRGS
jgi:hypothetical protein